MASHKRQESSPSVEEVLAVAKGAEQSLSSMSQVKSMSRRSKPRDPKP